MKSSATALLELLQGSSKLNLTKELEWNSSNVNRNSFFSLEMRGNALKARKVQFATDRCVIPQATDQRTGRGGLAPSDKCARHRQLSGGGGVPIR